MPISEEYYIKGDFIKNIESLDPRVINAVEGAFSEYAPKSAFELVALTHSEKPWNESRSGLQPTEPSNNPITVEQILSFYGC